MAKAKRDKALEQALDLLESSDYELSSMLEEGGLMKQLTKAGSDQ